MKTNSVSLLDIAATCLIGGVVAAVLAPAVGSAQTGNDALKREVALTVTCCSNEKQLMLAMLMYAQDYDERYPSGANWAGSGSGWAQQVYPYVKSSAIFKCPKDQSGGVSSYAYNSDLVHLESQKYSPPQGVTLGVLGSPASTVALFEVTGNHGPAGKHYGFWSETNSYGAEPSNDLPDVYRTGNPEAPYDGHSPAGCGLGLGAGDLSGMGSNPSAGPTTLKYATGKMQNTSSNLSYVAAPRHLGKAVFGFCDGHVKTVDPTLVSVGRDNRIRGDHGGGKLAANTDAVDGTRLSGTFSVY